MGTLTSANSVLMLGVEGLFNVPVQIQGYAADDAFTIGDVDMAETVMGVDGKLSAGWIPAIKTLDIMMQADSASNDFFDALIAAESVAREKYVMNGSILVPGISRFFVLTRGFMKIGSVMPASKKILQPRKFTIDFQDIVRSPV